MDSKMAARMPKMITCRIETAVGPRLIGLEDLLRALDRKSLEWRNVRSILIGPILGVNVLAFEEKAIKAPEGHPLSDPELWELGRRFGQVLDCDVRGYVAGAPVGEPVVLIEAFDGSEWTVAIDERHVYRLRVDLEKEFGAEVVTT